MDTVLLTCSADGNPKPDIVWRKLGQQSIFRIEEQLKFRSAHMFLMRFSLLAGPDEVSFLFTYFLF